MATKNPKSDFVVPAIASLPLDIINDIFVKLPSRSVIRCRSVCKQWLRLLTDPSFISIHFNYQNSNNNRKILCGPIHYKDGIPGDDEVDYYTNFNAFTGAFCSLHIQSSSGAADLVRLRGFPFLHKNYFIIQTIGYCNGLVCMLLSNYSFKEAGKRRFILIGNPSTGNYKISPEPTRLTRLGFWFFGFCYDSSIDDYKCVMIDPDTNTKNPHIFTLESNSWRTNFGSSYNGKITPEKGYRYNHGVALGRSIYWLVKRSNIIIEFDLDNEEFIELPLPSYMPNNLLFITVLGGSLCVTICCKEKEEVDMWLMSKDKKNKCCSWSNLMKMNIYDFGDFKIHPLCFMKDGKILCHLERLEYSFQEYSLAEKLFILLDPKTKSVEDFIIQDQTAGEWLERFSFQTHIAYTDSLVSPN